MSPTSPEPATGRGTDGGARDRRPAPDDQREPLVLAGPRLLWVVLAVVATYAGLWLLGQGPLDQVYTAAWTSRRIVWFFAPLTVLLLVLSRRVLPTVLSILGLVLGVVIGELIGGRIHAAEVTRLERDLAAGGLQSWEPVHHGWWIASLVFVALTSAGALMAWRAHRAATLHPDSGGESGSQ